MTIVYFILILGITVFVHEFGHFICAKKFGVHVYEFSLGMGPKLFKFNRKNDETDYCIRLFPIGGFVQMAGEDIEVDEKIPVNERLQSKPAHQRFIIMVAGVTMNFILSIIILFFIGLFNTVSFNNLYIADSIVDNLEDGDKIVSIDGRFVNNYDKLYLELALVGTDSFNMKVVDKDGILKEVELSNIEIGDDGLILGYDYGFEVDDLNIVESTISDLQINSIITKVNDVEVNSYLELLKEIKNTSTNFSLTVKNNNKEQTVNIKKIVNANETVSAYSYGFHITGIEEKGFVAAIKYAFYKFYSTVEQMIFTVLYLITGRLSLSMLSGPVGIFNAVGVYSKQGFVSLLSFLSLICINVGFINLLPFPAFDGGHVLFIIIEKIKGSRVNPKVENIIHTIGFVLLMILMLFVTFNDITKLF